MKIGIVNYGMGNLGSVRRALEELNAEVFVAVHPQALFDANRLVLPGVGAFTQGMQRLVSGGWAPVIRELVREQNVPLLGICLGMQMLATSGEEGGGCDGLQLIAGRIRRLDALGCKLRVPHVGWNDARFDENDQLFAHIPSGSDFYFVHSYAFEAASPSSVIASTDYGVALTAAVREGHVFGTQFHPEKSSRAGRQLLRNFLEYASC